ncbi:MAG: ABC transporter permease [Acidobacteria bacterium]|nr:ABC transporter permease [Acidobacteriota bacterium]
MRVRVGPVQLLLCAIAIYSVFAGRLAPYPAIREHREFPFTPPMRLHWAGFAGVYYCGLQSAGAWRGFSEDCTRKWQLRFFEEGRLVQPAKEGPFFLLGSDELGRDQLSRLLEGGRVTLSAGVAASLLTILIGLAIGIVSGYRGGRLDDLLMALASLFLTCPWIYLLLGIRALLPLSLPSEQSYLLVLVVAASVGWPRTARLIRGVVRSAREREYVTVARSLGASEWRIFRVHLMPELRHVATAQFAVLAPQFVLAEVTLSFVGLGIGEPGVSWGTMLAGLRDVSILLPYAWMALPCIPIAAVFFAFQWVSRRMQYTE